ncbi:signal peptidase I [Brevibacillus laterosporus]|uniref:Signal peptidase I n=1 Tax=Brevibacillus laterosporus TaxID=1465 RepID=A0AAP3DDS4_BRELA|nr:MULTISPECIES: signal peptidase I [Brevibacillus]ATO47982.1 signal peptidase I [Brevibacillus laterosporus DSM 25]MBG9773674.1 signal peptidase I [Brevibacillus laterosporus]MBG9788132.1 signal peptidase I [Brevibacillus laterosporus]MBG9800028.1 signal peptidase I [Brevibacillus laterosporus]MBG9803860.1 signal peptidase I [Brevibacillus laterosporus]
MSENASTTKKKNEAWEWIKAIVIAIALAFFIRTFLFAPFIVEGHSMDFTLHNEEKLVVNKALYHLREPQREEIIVFHASEKRDYIKRVIAVAGDTVEVKDDVLYVNDKVVEEPYLKEKRDLAEKEKDLPLTTPFEKLTIPPGHIYVMGDNRQNSSDSREFGPVEVSKVVGRAEFVFWPLKDIRMTR